MSDQARVSGAVGEVASHVEAGLRPLPEPGVDLEAAAKKLARLQALVQEQERLAAAVQELAERAQAERCRTEQELEKTAQLRASVEQERQRGEHERAVLERVFRGQLEHSGRGRFNWALFWTALSSLAAVVACLFSFWATREAANSVHETRQATRATVLLQLLSEHSSQEMLESMKRLREFRDAAGGASTLRQRYWDLQDRKPNPDNDGFALEQINNDRRRVKDFFRKLKGLAEDGIIDQTLVKEWWHRSTLLYLQDVLVPIEKANVAWMFERGRIDEPSKVEGNRLIEAVEAFFRAELG